MKIIKQLYLLVAVSLVIGCVGGFISGFNGYDVQKSRMVVTVICGAVAGIGGAWIASGYDPKVK